MGPLQVNWSYNSYNYRVKTPVIHLFSAISRGPIPPFIPGFWAHLVDHPRFTQNAPKTAPYSLTLGVKKPGWSPPERKQMLWDAQDGSCWCFWGADVFVGSWERLTAVRTPKC